MMDGITFLGTTVSLSLKGVFFFLVGGVFIYLFWTELELFQSQARKYAYLFYNKSNVPLQQSSRNWFLLQNDHGSKLSGMICLEELKKRFRASSKEEVQINLFNIAALTLNIQSFSEQLKLFRGHWDRSLSQGFWHEAQTITGWGPTHRKAHTHNYTLWVHAPYELHPMDCFGLWEESGALRGNPCQNSES